MTGINISDQTSSSVWFVEVNISLAVGKYPTIYWDEDSISSDSFSSEYEEFLNQWHASAVTIYAVITLGLLTILTASIINVLILYKLFKRRTFPSVTNVFSANLSIASLMFQFCLAVYNIDFLLDETNYSKSVLWLFVDLTYETSIQVTGFILMVMSYSRYRMVAHPLKSKIEWTQKKTWIYCLICFIVAVIMHIPLELGLLLSHHQHRHQPGYRYVIGIFKFSIEFLLPLLWVCHCYTKIVLIFRRGRFNQVSTAREGGSVKGNQRVIAQNRKLLKVTVLVVMVYAFTWGPIQIITLSLNWNFKLTWYEFTIYVLFVFLAVIGGCVQSMVFGWKTLKYGGSRIETST